MTHQVVVGTRIECGPGRNCEEFPAGQRGELPDVICRPTGRAPSSPRATILAGVPSWQSSDNNYFTQVDERGSWFYEAIGNTVRMQGRILGFGQVYLEASKDKDGNWLDGGKSYRMRVPANPPVVQFWSVTLYDNVTRGPVITDQGAADISSRQELATNSRRLGGPLLWPDKTGGGQELGQDHFGSRMVPLLPAVWTEGGLLRQVEAT
jgi:hypothetical protein